MDSDVSVIIPVYNGQPFIARAVDSVLRQTHAAAEIIVVNDGSTDRTLEALAPFGNRIQVITTTNRGVSSARNTGYLASCSSLIAYLDADDEWHEDKLARQVALLGRYPGTGLCCCDYAIDDGRGTRAASHFTRVARHLDSALEQWRRDPLLALIHGNFVGTTSTVVVRRDVLNAVGPFNARYRQAEDYDLWIRCAQFTRFAITAEVLLTKIGHDRNLTNDQIEMFGCHEEVLKTHVHARTFHMVPGGQREALLALATVRYQLANLFFEDGCYSNSVHYYLKALRTHISPRNVALFAYHASRKLGRILSFGKLRAHTV
jgi:glycosyltransferase involved in cell wall biosynthesis